MFPKERLFASGQNIMSLALGRKIPRKKSETRHAQNRGSKDIYIPGPNKCRIFRGNPKCPRNDHMFATCLIPKKNGSHYLPIPAVRVFCIIRFGHIASDFQYLRISQPPFFRAFAVSFREGNPSASLPFGCQIQWFNLPPGRQAAPEQGPLFFHPPTCPKKKHRDPTSSSFSSEKEYSPKQKEEKKTGRTSANFSSHQIHTSSNFAKSQSLESIPRADFGLGNKPLGTTGYLVGVGWVVKSGGEITELDFSRVIQNVIMVPHVLFTWKDTSPSQTFFSERKKETYSTFTCQFT